MDQLLKTDNLAVIILVLGIGGLFSLYRDERKRNIALADAGNEAQIAVALALERINETQRGQNAVIAELSGSIQALGDKLREIKEESRRVEARIDDLKQQTG